jgi:alanyl-tRNA synthetase
MSSGELRNLFLKFFQDRGHVIVPSSSLIPDDPSVLLTTAGMQQFKPYYTGELDPLTAIHGTLRRPLGSKNAASIQKCFRTSDIDEVGDESHLTFFEMLGNFSFGYKPGLTRADTAEGEPASPKGGYFKREAIEWAWEFIHHVLNVPLSRIEISIFEGDAAVPPDTESHEIWRSLGIPDGKIRTGSRKDNFWGPTGTEGPCGPTTEMYVDGIEVWNLVFNEFYQHPDKRLEPLATKGVDTGMGLERLALVMQYPEHPEQTIFATDLFAPILQQIPAGMPERHRRILADHARACAFLIADGVRPSNKEAGYVLRRLMRRMMTYRFLHGAESTMMHQMLKSVIALYGETYPELAHEDGSLIFEAFREEEEKFLRTLERGIRELERTAVINGAAAFKMYETYGLPFDIIKELGGERAAGLTREDFEREFRIHQEISRAGAAEKFGGHGLAGVSDEDARQDPTIWKMTRLHTATHLLHRALRNVLGPEVRQMGSDINPERTRFDFTFGRKVTPEELQKIEDEVNKKIAEDLPVRREVMSYGDAIKSGATAFFKEKYPETVSVYTIGDYSKELCGGPHVARTGEIGGFRILKEEAVSSGVRRIRAVIE